MLKCRGAICIFGKYMQNNLPLMLGPINYPSDNSQQVRNIKKHWNPKFRKERGQKVIKIDLPESYGSSTFSKKQELELKQGSVHLYKFWSERDIFVSCTHNILEPYVVPEGDGKLSSITKEGAKQKLDFIRKKGASYMAIKKIKSYDDIFSMKLFLHEALNIYKKAHELLVAKDNDKLLQYITETVYPQMVHNTINKTIHWKFLESLEPARVVHIRCTPSSRDRNADMFAQITVRFHTQQILCIYDRFGRPLQGSEILKKDVLDYVVFEKHLSNMYGTWRIHGKIIPSWMPPDEVAAMTYISPKEEDNLTDQSVIESGVETVHPDKLDEQKVKEIPPGTL